VCKCLRSKGDTCHKVVRQTGEHGHFIIMTLDELETRVIEWAKARRIIPNATAASQLLKAVSEMGELADAVNKSQRDEMKDAVGDVVVCLINLCALEGTTLGECLSGAWEEIKDRRGILLPNGVFVKEVM
jgi:NTP pyrophosphatase (non-canonical NTP hydrolase)